MHEKIYTIPVNEAFQKKCGCPICSVFEMLEKNETDIILGASMMEPDIRKNTNKLGFCFKHFSLMLLKQKRLTLALILDSHIDEVKNNISSSAQKQIDFLDKLSKNCYICSRTENYISQIYGTIFHLYSKEKVFKELFSEQPHFCLIHYKELLNRGQKQLSKREFEDFFKDISKIESKYLNSLSEDIKWFCKKFDYRFAEEDWKNSKDAIERTVYTLTGEK